MRSSYELYLYHYFDRKRGPFLSLTEMALSDAKAHLEARQREDPRSVNPNIEWFLTTRYDMERKIRDMFILLGGLPVRSAPLYMTLGEHPQLMTWYDDPECLKIPVSEFDPVTVSYTYGDSFPVFNPALCDGRAFWGKVYTLQGILEIIDEYGYPPYVEYHMGKWLFPADKPINQHLKYIEAHIWSDDIAMKYREKWLADHQMREC